jgi:hypothetical protein
VRSISTPFASAMSARFGREDCVRIERISEAYCLFCVVGFSGLCMRSRSHVRSAFSFPIVSVFDGCDRRFSMTLREW